MVSESAGLVDSCGPAPDVQDWYLASSLESLGYPFFCCKKNRYRDIPGITRENVGNYLHIQWKFQSC